MKGRGGKREGGGVVTLRVVDEDVEDTGKDEVRMKAKIEVRTRQAEGGTELRINERNVEI